MPFFGRIAAGFCATLALVAMLAAAAPATAQGLFDQPKYASIVVDANTGEVLYALRADQRRFPASISKVMTLYLTFEALATGRLSMEDRVPFSAHSAAQAPSKLGVPAGDSISVREAILGVTVKSANDAATALAERVGGSEPHFASLMTLRAQELGMKETTYVNANGLPDPRQISSARDIAILARAVMRDYPQYYSFFNAGSMSWQGHEVVNRHSFLQTIPGVDGLKTGYTNAAGHNLVASAVREGRRLITVVLGGTSNAARDENVEDLFDAGFAVLRRRTMGQQITLASLLHEPADMTGRDIRPSYEMGSADQTGLRVVTGQPAPNPIDAAPEKVMRADVVAPRMIPAALRMQPTTERECKTVTVRRHGRRVSERACHTVKVEADRTTLADCRHLRGKKARVCKADAVQMARAETKPAIAADCHGLRGRKLKSCRAETKAEPTQLALRDCKPKHGRHSKACAAEPAADRSTPDGGYAIQVGAFASRGDARAHLAKLTRSHGAFLGGASEKVEGGGKSYRARFAGLSAKEAKAACKRLSSKGERCMVLARS